MQNKVADGVRLTSLVLVTWLLCVSLLGFWDMGREVPALLRGPLVLLGIFVPVALDWFSPAFRRAVDRIPDAVIVGLHSWRIVAGLAFLIYGERNALPSLFAQNAGWGDIAVALLVPVVLLLPESRRKYVAFHLFGLSDFVVAVGTGIYFTLLQHPLQDNLFTFPLVLIPWFGVPLSGASHIITLRRLLMRSG